MKTSGIVAFILVIVGAINWLLIGLFGFDFVSAIFGTMSVLSRIIFSLVGVAGLWAIFYLLVYRPFDRIKD